MEEYQERSFTADVLLGGCMKIIKCERGGKEYGYEYWETAVPGGKEREEAIGPYCGEVGYSEMTSQFIKVYIMEEINKFYK